MNTILIGNIVVLIGAMIMVAIGFIKKKGQILIAQCFQFLIMGIGNLILGGVTGFISNIISIVRNLYCFKYELTIPLKLIFIAIQTALSLYVNTNGLIGLLPVAAACLFTWYLDAKEVTLKTVIVICQVMWVIYDLSIINYTGCFFDALTIVTNIIGIYMIKKSA